MHKRHLIQLFGALLALTFVVPLFAQEASAETYTIAFQSVAPAKTPWARQLNRLKKSWLKQAKEEGIDLKVKIFLGRGNEKALVRKCKAGELQAVGVTSSAMVDEVPEMGAFELPYLFDSEKQADKVIDKLFPEVESILAENGFKLLLFSENGFRHFAAKGKAIKAPGDLAALKMRVQENWIHEETYRALGGNPVRISVAEVLTSLSTGQVNGFDNTPLYAFATSWFNEVDNWTVSNHIYQPGVLVFNKKWFNGLPPKLQTILLSNREKETKKGRRAIRKLTPKLLTKLEEKGVKVHKLSAGERAKFKAATQKVHQKFNKKGGKHGAKLLKMIKSNL